MSEIIYFQTKHFDRALNQANLKARRIADKVKAVLWSINEPKPFASLKVTNNGETRLAKCVKYDLSDGWRLVTVQDSKTCGFVFVGTHDETDRFLDNHKGTRFGVKDGKLVPIPGAGIRTLDSFAQAGATSTSLIELLGQDDEFVFGGLPIKASLAIGSLTTSSSADEMMAALACIADEGRRAFISEILGLLAAGNEDGWKNRIAYERGEIVDADSLDPDTLISVADGDEIRRIVIGSADYERYMAHLEADAPWHDWFLYLHPEQERVMNRDYEGTAQLSGVSGSGKTCVLVRRAGRLAEKPGSRVLILTLNRSLAGLLQKLVNASATHDQAQRIQVCSFFDLARELLIELVPEASNSLDETSWKLAEHVDEVFREYFRCWFNNADARVLEPIKRQLTARNVNAESYLREEFDWIRSALPSSSRSEYLKIERTGRRVPITEERRHDILAGLEGWERKMKHVGVVDYLALTEQLNQRLDLIAARYDHILIDEAQDFGTTELQIVRKLVAEGPNDIFLCGDIAQTVLPKSRKLSSTGIVVRNRDNIRQNYRNSREILKAAYSILVNNLDDELFEDGGLELLDPKYANFSSGAPLALRADTLEEEIAYARTYAQGRLEAGTHSVCIAFAGYTARDIEAFAKKCGVPSLNGLYDPKDSPLVFSDLEQTKGYEFDTLIVVNCREGVLPAVGAPEEEAFRQGCKLYVAMTRARRELVLSFNTEASPWLVAVADTIQSDEWANCEEFNAELMSGVPDCLPELEDDTSEIDAAMMTGSEFLFTDYALGLSLEAQKKLTELVDGRGARTFDNRRVRWAHLGDLADDLARSRRSDNLFGSKVVEEVRTALSGAMPERPSPYAGRLGLRAS